MNRKVLENFRKYGMLTAFALICLVLSLITPNFFALQNMTIILRQVSINGILAIGVTFVIISGGIDLSLGSVVAFTGVVAALFARSEARRVGKECVSPFRSRWSPYP